MIGLCDIDGVVANPCEYVRRYLSTTPKNWGEYYRHTLDMPPIESIVAVLDGLMVWGGHTIYFVTGRNESNRELTSRWLNTHLRSYIRDEFLFMRPNSFSGPTFELKLQWAIQLRPDIIFEDEPATISVLRSKGFKVIQVCGYRETDTDHVPYV